MFSIVIPVYGEATHLDACLSALVGQTLQATEIVVVHTGPGDPTDWIVEAFPQVRVHHEDIRQYAGGARNKGAAITSGAWLAFLDSDMIADRDWLKTMASAAAQYPSDVLIGSVGCQADGLWGLVMWFVEFGSVLPHRPRQRMTSGPSANFAVSRRSFDQVGGFRTDLYAAEDGDLFCRMREKGIRLCLIPDALAVHRFHGGLGSLRRLIELGRAASFLRRQHSLPGSIAVRFSMLAFALPFARLAQMARRLIGEKGPIFRFLLLSPFIFVGLVSWSIGFYRESRHPTYPTR